MNPSVAAGGETSGPALVLTAIVSCTAGAVLPAVLTGALAVQMGRALGFGTIALGLAVSVFFIASGSTSALLGRFIDDLGWRRAVRLAAAATAVCLGGIGGVVDGLTGLIIFLVIGGVANGIAVPAANLAIAAEVRPQRWAMAFGLKQTAGSAAFIIGGLSIPLIVVTWGYRWVFLGSLMLPVVAGALTLAGTRRGSSGSSVGLRRAVRSNGAGAARGRRRLPSGLRLIAVAGGLGAASALAVGTFFTASAVGSGATESHAGQLLAVGSVGALVLRIVYGWAADAWRSSGYLPIIVLLGLGGVGFAFVGYGNVSWLTTLLVFGAGSGWQGLIHFSVVHAHQQDPALVTGVLQAGMSSGAAIGPLAFGLGAGAFSLSTVWWCSAAVMVLAALFVAAGVRRGRHAPDDRSGRRTAPVQTTC